MSRSTLLAAAVALALITVGVVITRQTTGSWLPTRGNHAGPPAAMTPGRDVTLSFSDHPQPAPVLQVTSLEGTPVDAASWRGKVVFVNFWATWCGPCREEIPALLALQEQYADQLMILGLSIDTVPPAEVQKFAAQFKLNYPVAMSTSQIEDAFGGVSAVPVTFVIDPEGRVVKRHVGMINPQVAEHEIRALTKLPTEAKVTYVKDTRTATLGNAAYATEIPGVDMSALTPTQKEAALKRLNAEKCTCGCGLTLAQCRINDPDCEVSLPLAKTIVAGIAK